MSTKLFFRGLIATALVTASFQFASAQDSTKKAEAVKPPVYKPKPIATQSAVNKPVVTNPTAGTYPPKQAVPKPVTAAPTVPAGATQPYAQPALVEPNDRSLKGQYQYLFNKTYGYQRPMVAAFYKSVTDTLNFERKKLKPLQANITALKDSVKALHGQLSTQEQTLSESTTKVDNISLAGINMTKSAYNTLMWGLVVAFGAVAAVIIVRSGSYSREAKYRIKLYEDLDEEYKTYKAKANDKEKKLARELQTARNKLEELTGNPGY